MKCRYDTLRTQEPYHPEVAIIELSGVTTNGSARIDSTPNVDAGINGTTHLGGHRCGGHEGDGDDSTDDRKLAEHKTATCPAPFRDVMTTLARSFADDYLERVVLSSAPDLDHVDLVDDGKSAIWVKVLRC